MAKIRSVLRDIVLLAGILSVGYGTYIIYEPITYIFLGLTLIYMSRPKG
jgi:hypothetical protein